MRPYIVRIISLERKVGKTSVGTSIVRFLSLRGVKAAVVKHAHRGIDLYKDTGKYLGSGADSVIALSENTIALYVNYGSRSIEEAFRLLPRNYGVIIAEGFKEEDIGDAIGVVRSSEEAFRLLDVSKNIIAFVNTGGRETRLEDIGIKVFNAYNEGDLRKLAEIVYGKAVNHILKQLPGTNCGKCGYSSCLDYARAYLCGKTGSCPVTSKVVVEVNGKNIVLSPFVKNVIRNTIIGLLSALKDTPRDVNGYRSIKIIIEE